MKQRRFNTKAEYDSYMSGLRSGWAGWLAFSLAGALGTGYAALQWESHNQRDLDEMRIVDVQNYQQQIREQLQEQDVEVEEGTLPIIQGYDDTFKFQMVRDGARLVCSASFTEYYSTARINPDIKSHMSCEQSTASSPAALPTTALQ